jgi:hypothetical protein
MLSLVVAACTPTTTPHPPPLSNESGGACLATLDQLGIRYELEPRLQSVAPACHVATPVKVIAATVPWNQPAIADCALVLAFDRFEREVLRPVARSYFGTDVRTIYPLGAYSCRTTRGGRESEHAHGTALDFAGVELADGRRILVKDSWRRHDQSSAFLHAVATRACAYFNEVLSPDSDADHYDHIHLDLGPYRLCVRR